VLEDRPLHPVVGVREGPALERLAVRAWHYSSSSGGLGIGRDFPGLRAGRVLRTDRWG
jgi:hypothetical protein